MTPGGGRNLKKQPVWWTSIVAYLAYLVVFIGTWVVVGADYMNLVGREVVFRSLDLPLILGTVLLVPVITWLGWWRPVMVEERRGGPAWTMWALLAIMACLIVTGLAATDWSALAAGHIALLALAGVLVGFNEEALTRGILMVAFRGSMRSEVWVCIWATVLFGLLHLPNAFIGLGLIGALMQVVFATFAGVGFYVMRRVSGGLVVPMAVHGVWDFANFIRLASGGAPAAIAPVFQFGTYFVAVAAAVVLLRAARRSASPAGAAWGIDSPPRPKITSGPAGPLVKFCRTEGLPCEAAQSRTVTGLLALPR
jgi:membrane protease YdiL (CAAX protease family)